MEVKVEEMNTNPTTIIINGNETEKNLLLDLPEIVHDKLFTQMLSRLDLLKLRIICKTTCARATRILRKKFQTGWTNLEIVENESDSKSANRMALEKFMENQPFELLSTIKKLYINNETDGIFQHPKMTEFLNLYGSGIKKLKLKTFSISSPFQRQFFSKLTNLHALKIEEIDAHIHDYFENKPEKLEASIPPETFKQIRILKIGTIFAKHKLDTDYPDAFIGNFPNLETLRYPYVCFDMPRAGMDPGSEFRFLQNYIENQNEKLLKRIDMKNLNDYENDIITSFDDFANFLGFLNEHKNLGIKLDHVNEKYFTGRRMSFTPHEHDDYYWNISSLRNLSQNLAEMEFPDLMNLKKLNFSASESITTSSDGMGFGEGEINGDFWMHLNDNMLTNLQKLRVQYDLTLEQFEEWDEALEEMSIFFFESEHRAEIFDLSIQFADCLRSVKIPARIFHAVEFGYNFTALKKLELINWNPGNKSFISLWDALSGNPNLEELILKDCPSLGNVGFIGTNEAEPVFLGLTRLKRLTLKVDFMKKLTDRSFKDVFRHMGLEEFYLISDGPMDMITREGILWLLRGRFAETIQKFSFNTWTASTILASEMLDIKSQFKNLIY